MTNETLAADYLKRAKGRVRSIETLMQDELYADVVRECQEACELALKSVIRKAGHTVPFNHDVSSKLLEIKSDLPESVVVNLRRFCEISKELRRDRELSFYGSEDVTPSEFYEKSHAEKALAQLNEVLKVL
jgi:HEPN domain-containing protein